MNEIDKFFGDLPEQDKKVADVFNDKATPEEGTKKDEPKETEEETEVRKNRRHRRLEEQLQRERESNIALNERLKTLAEVDRTIRETSGEIDPRLIRVFGTSEEGKEIAKHFTEILVETKESARAEALQEIENQEKGFKEEQNKYENIIDANLQNLEDEYNVDLTSDTPRANKMRKEFLEMVETLSPKDENGVITDYADFGSTFEVYQGRQNRVDNTRQREIASKSMQRSGPTGSEAASKVTPGFRGWETDYGL